MKKSPLIAVIVPVYNGSPFLERCVKSVQAQTYTHWELFLVDDGSTDNSLSLCRQLAATDSRIHVIHQKNQGNTVARNTGINAALAKENADFIAFMDQDDLLPENAYQTLIDLHQQTGAEIVWGQVVNMLPTTKLSITPPRVSEKRTPLSLEDMLSTTEPWCWNKLYVRRLFTEGLRFDVRLSLGEDIDFIFRAAQLANFLAFTPSTVYIHTVHAESTSHRPQIKRYIDALGVWENIYAYAVKHRLDTAKNAVYHVLVNNQADLLLVILLYDTCNNYMDIFRKTRQNFKKNAQQFFSNTNIPWQAKIILLIPWLDGALARFLFRFPGIRTWLCSAYEKKISTRC